MFHLLLAALLFASAPQTPATNAAASAPVAWKRERGPFEVASLLEDWRDEARKRDVPVKIWYPRGDGPFPVIVFSHGLGGTREGYAYLGEHWASHGYVSVHLQHKGSDDETWRGSAQPMEDLQKAASDLGNLLDRPKDVSFALDELARRNAQLDWALKGKLDLANTGVAGHSFGAYTALCAAGRALVGPGGNRVELGDTRLTCCVAMSPQGHEREKQNGSWNAVKIPCFHMTGTRDTSPIRGDAKPEERRIPYDAIEHADEYLLVLDGAEHMAFSDSSLGAGSRDPADHPLILEGSTAFFDAYLKHDAKALAWLRDGGFAAELAKNGTFEHKSAALAETTTTK